MDVALETDIQLQKQKSRKPLLWIAQVSIVMLFASLTSAVVVKKNDADWLQFEIPMQFFWSTMLIILSSLSFVWASVAVRKNQLNNVKAAIGLTLLLGLAFAWLQFQGWDALVDQGVYFTGPKSSAAGSFFYVLTLAHLFHLIGGIISLIVVFFKSVFEKYNSKNFLGLQLSSIYWHFLDALWIYLFIFLKYFV